MGHHLLGARPGQTENRFVLGGSGHIADVVNPPAVTRSTARTTRNWWRGAEDWLKQATREGLVVARLGRHVDPLAQQEKAVAGAHSGDACAAGWLKALEDAPGSTAKDCGWTE